MLILTYEGVPLRISKRIALTRTVSKLHELNPMLSRFQSGPELRVRRKLNVYIGKHRDVLTGFQGLSVVD